MPEHTSVDPKPAATPSASDIRKQIRNQRRALSTAEQLRHSQQLCNNICTEKIYKNSSNIACYIANDSEIDPVLIIEHAWMIGKNVYLPVLSPLNNNFLYFAPFKPNSSFRYNRFNIPEPICRPALWKTAQQLDLLLLPLVAFDAQGNRLGMGGGFYDRTLAYLKCRNNWKKPILAGLAHEIQKTELPPAQSWDIPLDYIITEKQSYTAARQTDS